MKWQKNTAAVLKILAVLFLIAGLAMLILLGYLESRFPGNERINLPPASRNLAPEKSSFRIAVFGDFAMQSSVFQPILHDISQLNPDFAVSIGDMFRKARGAEGAYLLEQLSNNLKIPFVTVPGNHDCPRDAGTKSYMRYFGQLYYYFSYGDTLFLMLDNSSGDVGEEQFLWMERILKNNRQDFRRCAVFIHIPPVFPRDVYKNPVLPWSGKFMKICQIYKVDAIVSGHLHISEKTVFHGIPVLITPCCGQRQRDKIIPHFGFLELRFPAEGGIKAVYHHHPGLKRGRNAVLCAIVNGIPGKPVFFYAGVISLTIGFLFLLILKMIRRWITQ